MTKKNANFSKEFLAKIKEVLVNEKERLVKELRKFSKKNPNVEGDWETTFPEYGDKSDENAQEITQYLANKPLELTLEKSLRDVNKTMERLDSDDYGICKYCHEPMKEERLLARPTSGACVSCKKTLTNEA